MYMSGCFSTNQSIPFIPLNRSTLISMNLPSMRIRDAFIASVK